MTSAEGMRPPRQARSRRTAERFVDAAVELMQEQTFEEIRVDDIVSRAGASKGAFYYRFPSKADLLRHLHGELYRAALEGWNDFLDPVRWREAALGEFVEALVGRLVRIYVERRELMAALVREAALDSVPGVREKARELNEHVLAGTRAVLREHLAEVGHPRPEAALRLALTVLGATLPVLLAFEDDPSDLTELQPGEVHEELARMMRRYLEV